MNLTIFLQDLTNFLSWLHTVFCHLNLRRSLGQSSKSIALKLLLGSRFFDCGQIFVYVHSAGELISYKAIGPILYFQNDGATIEYSTDDGHQLVVITTF